MIRAMKKVKYVIKATKFKDNTYEDVVFENQPLSQKQETFSDVKHILDLDFEIALDEGKKVQYCLRYSSSFSRDPIMETQ